MKVQNSNISLLQIEQFKLESGLILDEVEIAYTTYGQLSKSGDNAILVFHALTGSHLLAGEYEQFDDSNLPWNDELELGWWDDFVGPTEPLIQVNISLYVQIILVVVMGPRDQILSNFIQEKNFQK